MAVNEKEHAGEAALGTGSGVVQAGNRRSLLTIAPDNITRSATQLQFSVRTFPEFSAELRRFRLTVAGSRGMDGCVKKTMRIFTIDAGNCIAVSTSTEQRSSTSGAARFTNEKQLSALAAHWPSGRLVEVWNHLPGVRKIAKFTDRQTGTDTSSRCTL